MRVLVCGSRDWDDRFMMGLVLRGFYDKYPDLAIIEGCARGADHLAEEFAAQFNLPDIHFPALWDDYPKHLKWRAGHDRNIRMLDEGKPDYVVAFKDGLLPSLEKGGTEHMVKISRQAGIPVMVVAHGWRSQEI